MTLQQLQDYVKSLNIAVTNHPVIQPFIAQGNSAEALSNAVSTGNLTGIVDNTGQPFSLEDQQKALAEAEAATKAFYDAQKQYETQNAEAKLKQQQLDYQKQMADASTKFETDKQTLDQNAANQGVLFSGGRAQKERALQNQYTRAQEYNQASTGADIAGTARDYQYKYGNNAAQGLNQYYNLAPQTYNANVSTGGVSQGGLSSVYNPSNSNFQGTQVTAQKAANLQRAAGSLWNKGNKLIQTGMYNQK
jgi:hypothetical protein